MTNPIPEFTYIILRRETITNLEQPGEGKIDYPTFFQHEDDIEIALDVSKREGLEGLAEQALGYLKSKGFERMDPQDRAEYRINLGSRIEPVYSPLELSTIGLEMYEPLGKQELRDLGIVLLRKLRTYNDSLNQQEE
jgi:hypothetical protein